MLLASAAATAALDDVPASTIRKRARRSPASGGECQRAVTVCHPVWRLERGGLERQLLQTVRRLPSDRFRHLLIVRGCDAGAPLPIETIGEHVRVVREPGGGKDRTWGLRLAALMREHRVGLIHVRGLSMLLDALLAARLAGDIPVAFSFHGFEQADPDFGVIRRNAYRAAVARCDARWAVSSAAAAAIADKLGLDRASFDVLPNGVDIDRYLPPVDQTVIRRRLNLPIDRTLVLCVGNLKPVKGHADLLEAMADLGPAAARLTLVVAGRDCLGGSLQAQAAKQVPHGDIRFVGEQSDVLSWYQAADVFVLPSHGEGLSNALLEAMACGLPVVATAVGGNRDVIVSGRNGLLVEPANPRALAQGLRQVIDDETGRRRLGRAGRWHVMRHHAASIALRRYETQYAQLAGGPALRAAPMPQG